MSDGAPERWSGGHDIALLALIDAAAELAVPGFGGAFATAVGGILERRRARMSEFLTGVVASAPPDALLDRLRADPRFGDLFVNALQRVATAGWEPKRVAMGRVVLQALNGDEAEIDESERLLAALHDLEAADFATLARLHAETEARSGTNQGIVVDDVPGLQESLGALFRHGVLTQSSAFGGAMAYSSTTRGEKLLALVWMPGTEEESNAGGQ